MMILRMIMMIPDGHVGELPSLGNLLADIKYLEQFIPGRSQRDTEHWAHRTLRRLTSLRHHVAFSCRYPHAHVPTMSRERCAKRSDRLHFWTVFRVKVCLVTIF
eukprot:5536431-Amphidinium_carterae.1